MRRFTLCAALVMFASVARADSFGTGDNAFDIDFVTISGSTNPTDSSNYGGYGIVGHNYRMGVYEITNDQWGKFVAAYGTPTGSASAYNESFYDDGTGTTNVPTNNVSWYEAAQFVNWLNTSAGHHPAYKFTGTQGTGDYTFATWSAVEAAWGTNLYRHKDAFYFLPTEAEWFKAAYWNGSETQEYATKPGDALHQGDGTSGTGWNYDHPLFPAVSGPWDVGSGSEELNGTYDMMSNAREWMESPYLDRSYGASSDRGVRGGIWLSPPLHLGAASFRDYGTAKSERRSRGFRVASVPEPGSITLLVCGAVVGLIWWRRRK